MDIKVGDWVRVQAGPQCGSLIAEGTVTYVTTDQGYWLIESNAANTKPRSCWYWKQRHDGGQVLEHRPQ